MYIVTEWRPDPERERALRCALNWSSLTSVAEAVSLATEDERSIYVERRESQWRWSLVSRGGPYPLQRITARFLRADYHDLVMAFRATGDACILSDDSDEEQQPADAWAILDFDGPTVPTIVTERILQAVGPESGNSRDGAR